MSQPNTSGGQVAATWQDLAKIPQLLGDVKTGILTLRTLISTPAAAMATGSPPASAAIVALGAELLVFLGQTVQAIDDDIDAMTKTAANYQRNETKLTGAANAGSQALGALTPAQRPTLNGGVQSCTARGALHAASVLDDVTNPAAAAVRTLGDASQYVLNGTANGARTVGNAAGSVLDQLPYIPGIGMNPRVGASGTTVWGQAARTSGSASSSVLIGASDAVEVVERSATATAAAASRISTRADSLLTLDGSCSTGTVRSNP